MTTWLRGPLSSPDCANCPFARNGKPSSPVAGEGPDNAAWIVVGEGPGQQEVRQGRPLVGPTGQLLNRAIKMAGGTREHGFLANATLCKPTPGSSEAMRHQAAVACRPRLNEELAQFPGKPILSLGGVASQGFLGQKFSITQLAGSAHTVDVDTTGARVVIPTIHPAAILRGGAGDSGSGAHAVDMLFLNLVYDFAKVMRLGSGAQNVIFTPDIETEWEDPLRAERLIEGITRDARRLRIVGCDTETYTDVMPDGGQHSALETQHAKLSAIAFATPERAVSITWNVVTKRALMFMRALMGDSTIEHVFHNGLYDIPVLRRHSILTRGKITDTMLLHHNAFPGLAHGLQRVVTQFLIAHPWKAEYREGNETPEEHTRYNALDILGTVRVKPQLEICVKKSRAEKTYEIDIKMARAAMQMSWVGMHVSREINADLRKYFTEEAVIARDIVHARVSEPGIWEEFQQNLSFEQAKKRRKKDSDDFEARQQKRLLELEKVFKKKLKQKGFELDIDSAQHVAAYLRACGVPLTLETEKGAISTKRDILEGLAHHETVRKLLDYREVTKMNSTFVRPLPFYMDANDRVHPTWSVHKITGRWASAMPVVSNLPKDDKKKNRPNLRKQYTAPKGRILVGADFKQLEGRIIALLSNDPFLCRVFNENRDLHSEMARTVWPKFDSLPPDERKKLRDMVKRPEYCLVPGTRILRRDLSWANIEDLRPGDELVGFTASQPNDKWTENYFKPTVVKKRKMLRQQCYRIVTDRGEVAASAQHMWVARRPYAAPKYKAVGTKGWFRTDSLRVGDEMIFTSEPWQFAESREAGYLAGIYDGEGWIAKKGVGFAQNPGVALDNVEAIQQRLGIEAHSANKATRKEKIVRSEIAGGIWGSLRFLGMIRPDRLLLKSDKVWNGRRLRCNGEGAKILSIEPVGLRDVVAVMTTTETFIAEGFLSHNCALYGGAPETSWQAVVRDYPTVQLADIVRMVALMKKNMPRIDQWHDELVANVMQTLEIRSFLYGRRRMFPMGNASPSEIYNFPVQAAGADIMDTGMANLMDKLPDTADIISQVHDFVGVECYEDDAEKIRDIVVECCTQQHTVNGVTVDFPVDAHIGHSLADV